MIGRIITCIAIVLAYIYVFPFIDMFIIAYFGITKHHFMLEPTSTAIKVAVINTFSLAVMYAFLMWLGAKVFRFSPDKNWLTYLAVSIILISYIIYPPEHSADFPYFEGLVLPGILAGVIDAYLSWSKATKSTQA
jgi:hypothetical protein